MIEKRIFLALIFMSCSLSAQIKGIVKDRLSGKPIPYVNIWVENESIGSTSEENGTFFINTTADGKRLIFSTLGYEKKIIDASEASEINLKPASYLLNEVVISKSIGTKEQIIGGSKKMWLSHLSGNRPFILAKFFKYQDRYQGTPFIKTAVVFTKSGINNASFKLRLFKVDNEGFPGEDLQNQDIVVYVKKGRQKNSIDLSRLSLRIPKEGIFIAFESMMIESNKYEYSSNAEEQKKSKDISFAPSLICNPVANDFTFSYMGGKWIKMAKNSLAINFLENKIIEPAINLTLTN